MIKTTSGNPRGGDQQRASIRMKAIPPILRRRRPIPMPEISIRTRVLGPVSTPTRIPMDVPQPFPQQPYPGAQLQPYSQQQPYPMQQMYGPPFVLAPMAAPYGIEPTTGRPYSEKSKIVAGLLQIFLGGFGVGRFYKGDVGVGLAQLILNLTVGWFTLGATLLWPWIDGIIMMAGNPTDREGRPLRG